MLVANQHDGPLIFLHLYFFLSFPFSNIQVQERLGEAGGADEELNDSSMIDMTNGRKSQSYTNNVIIIIILVLVLILMI